MNKKFIFFLIFFKSSVVCFSQITITEVYYNTPYNEKLKFDEKINGVSTGNQIDAIKHHRGEFVEIYNYSDRDLSLKNWYLKDFEGIFWLPDKIIKSGELMVIAYSVLPYNTTTFSDHFPSTLGKENQIIYQDKILLRNKYEIIVLGYAYNDQLLLDRSGVFWDFPQEPPQNFIPNSSSIPNAFYTVNSLQLDPNSPQPNYSHSIEYMEATPNPLAANYTPPITSYESTLINEYHQYYSYLDWNSNVLAITENTCPISIDTEEQSPYGSYTNDGKCMSYDDSGNSISSSDCYVSKFGGGTTNKAKVSQNGLYSKEELEMIMNDIIIYPNPTRADVTIKWKGVALDKISSFQIYNAGGNRIFNIVPEKSQDKIDFSLKDQLPGVYLVNFTLNTGQFISKKILKW